MLKIKQAREALGISQREFARRMGVDVAFVNRYENGKQSPSCPTLKNFADVLGVATVELLPEQFWTRPDGKRADKPL